MTDPHPAVERDAECEAAVPAAPPMPAIPAPQPLSAGTYAVYDDGGGGIMLVVQPDGAEVMRHHIPARMIRAAEGAARMMGGAGLPDVRGLFGGGRGGVD